MTKHPLFDLLEQIKETPEEYPHDLFTARRAKFTAQMEIRLSMGFAALMPNKKAENADTFSAIGKHISNNGHVDVRPS